MSEPAKYGVFFEEEVVSYETWRLKRVANAARELIDKKSGINAFVWSDDEQCEHFMITLAKAPEKPTSLYEANLIDENADPQLKCIFRKD
jgi:hypothetical protein